MIKYLLIALLLLNPQDEENPQDIDPGPLVPKIDELKLMRREKLQAIIGSLFLERYLEPFDDWVNSRGFVKEQMFGDDDYNKEIWFALVIKTSNEEPIWIKFFLNKTYAKHEHLGFAADDILVKAHATRMRISLKASLEQTVIINLDNEEVRKSLIYGTAHLYRLITKDSDVTKVRKEDLIY